MKAIIFSLVCLLTIGCNSSNPPKTQAGATNTTEAVAEAPAANTNKAPSKIDYEAINKSIFKDVSSKVVDKAVKKE
jgi:hypothetical protein